MASKGFSRCPPSDCDSSMAGAGNRKALLLVGVGAPGGPGGYGSCALGFITLVCRAESELVLMGGGGDSAEFDQDGSRMDTSRQRTGRSWRRLFQPASWWGERWETL